MTIYTVDTVLDCNEAGITFQNDAGEEWEVFNHYTGADVLRCGSEARCMEACTNKPYDYSRAGFSVYLDDRQGNR